MNGYKQTYCQQQNTTWQHPRIIYWRKIRMIGVCFLTSCHWHVCIYGVNVRWGYWRQTQCWPPGTGRGCGNRTAAFHRAPRWWGYASSNTRCWGCVGRYNAYLGLGSPVRRTYSVVTEHAEWDKLQNCHPATEDGKQCMRKKLYITVRNKFYRKQDSYASNTLT